jgi:peptide/nickel transport system substrate-binding protein
MTSSPLRWLAATFCLGPALMLGACGSDNDGGAGAPIEGKKGGTLIVLAEGDVDHIDPGQAYYQFTYMVSYATQRPLYSYPAKNTTPVPDLAAGDPQISSDGRMVTVEIKKGVKFSPPVNREVVAKDVKYAIERQFKNTVANGYAPAYYGDLIGAKAYQKGQANEITGITTPDDRTVVFKLGRGTGGVLAGALSLPGSSPVPKEYAAKFDAKNPSTYGRNQVATGPYMIQNDSSGKLVGYKPNRRITLVRNPNWTAENDYRPAYLDRIEVKEGLDSNVAARQILTGRSMVNGDFAPPPAQLRQALTRRKGQVILAPSGGLRYVSLNTKIKPFDNLNVRKAILAVFDREAMRLTRGGAALGEIATHFIPPEIPGFEEAGGTASPVDFLAKPGGDLALAKEYMRKAGYKSGLYNGSSSQLLMVGSNVGVAPQTAQVALAQFEKLGFKPRLRLVTTDAMYTKFCNVPKANVAICPNVGWLKDFNDPQTILGPTFDGDNIVPVNNSNWPLLDDPAINKLMDAAELITDPEERAKTWGEIDKKVTALAPAVPWIWDNQPNIHSANVNAAINKNQANYDLNFTSVKS